MKVSEAVATGDTLPPAPPKPRWRGVLHRSAFFTALGLAPGLVAIAPTAAARVSVAIYAVTLCGLFGISALLHRVDWTPAAQRRMGRLDHAMIFVFIAGTYTPITVLTVDGALRTWVLGLVWGAAAIGGLSQLVPIQVPRAMSAAAYVGVGWVALLALPALWAGLGPIGFALVLAGGLAYSVGAVVYARQRPDPVPDRFGFHEVFHACTIVGAALHLAVIVFWALPRA